MRARGGAVRLAASLCAITAIALELGTASAQDSTDPSSLRSGYSGETVDAIRQRGLDETAARGDDFGGSAAAGPVDPRTYMVGPGDVLQVYLTGRLTRRTIATVGAEGALFIPELGVFQVARRTLASVRDMIVASVQRQLRGVNVNIQLIRVRTMRLYLTGAVANPGALELPATSRVSDLVPLAATVGGASRRNVVVKHHDGTMTVADLELFERTGRVDQNPFLVDGDIVHVPMATEFVEIRGAVARPGRYELGPEDSLITIIELAGGPLPSALIERSLMVRWVDPSHSDSTVFNLEDPYTGRFNPRLRNGDHIYIYLLSQFQVLEQASIFGEVVKPGTYPLEIGRTRLSDLVRFAGGFTERANLATIRIYREVPGSSDSDPEFDRLARLSRGEMTDSEYEKFRTGLARRRGDFRVDWTRLAETPELDIILRDGDVVRADPLIASVRVDGEVRRPGMVAYDPGRSVDEYVELAGGYSKLAARGKVLITRAVTGQTLRARDVPSVSPADLIWVPERKTVDFWGIFREGLAVAGQIAVIVVATRR